MKYNPIYRAVLLSLALLLAAGLFAPSGTGRGQAAQIGLFPQWVDLSNFPEVRIHFSAWDASGLPLAGLTAEQLSVQENDGAPIPAHTLERDPQSPLWVALVIDVSGSMAGQPLIDAKAAAARFLDRLGPDDQAALIAFSDPIDPQALDPNREAAFTAELGPIYTQIEGLTAGGQTQLYAAAAKAVWLFDEVPPGHRAILLLTDGRNEPAGQGDPELAIRLAQEERVPVFVIGLGKDIDLPYLERLTGETGGLLRAAPSSAELARLFAETASLLKTEYALTYTSALPAEGGEHTLTVALTVDGETVTAAIPSGELPVQAPTPTAPPDTATPLPPTATATPVPPTATPLPPTPLPSPTPTQPPAGLFSSPLVLPAIGAAVLALVGGLALALRRRPPAGIPEVCAKCGFDLTGVSGACPQCGSVKRLPKPR